jgi:DNA-binding beta-propeller fold protein YncE
MPYGVATDALNNVYVVDKDNSRIQKFTPQGAFIRAWGSPGTGPGQFQGPQGIAIDPDGNVYVTDVGNGRVQRFDVRGNFLGQFAWSGEWIATDSAGSVYVSDDPNDRVLKLSPAGNLIATVGPAAGDKALVRPWGVATDRLGNVYVADPGFVTPLVDPGALVKFKPVE